MGCFNILVNVAKLGNPETSVSKDALDALELVKFTLGNFEIDTLEVLQVGKCHYVEDCGITVPIDVSYFISRNLKDDTNNADRRERIRFMSIYNRVAWHARAHYRRVVRDVVPTWTEELQKELRRVLPTRESPTDLGKNEIKQQIGSLMAYYVELLALRIGQDIRQWDQTDYPKLEKFVRRFHVIWKLAVPKAPKSKRSKPPKLHFPSCKPKASI